MAPAAPGEAHGVAYKDDMSFGWKPLQGGNGRLFSGILEGEQTSEQPKEKNYGLEGMQCVKLTQVTAPLFYVSGVIMDIICPFVHLFSCL